MEGLRRHADKVKFLLVHHEETAAFMATAYAKATGRIGVCLATSGPGGIHLANGQPVPVGGAGAATRHRPRLPGTGGPAHDADLRRAAEAFNAGGRIAILAGIGARGAGRLVEQAADTL